MIAEKPTYEELVQRVKKLEQESRKLKAMHLNADAIKDEAKDATQNTENLYRQLIDIYDSPINVYDRELRLIFMNRKAAEFLGGKPEDFIGKKITEYFLSPIAEDITEKHRNIIETGQANDFELLIEYRGKKTWYWSHYQPIKDKDGNITILMVISYDITERKKIDEELRRSEYLLNQAQQLAHLGSYEYDIIHNHIKRSDELYRIFGITKDELDPKKRITLLIHPNDRDNIEKRFQLGKAGHIAEPYEFKIIRPDGEQRVIFANYISMFDDNGVPIKSIGFLLDITERKNMEEKLRRSEYLLNQAQQLAHLGSYEYDIINNCYERSDELFRIYGVDKDQVAPDDHMTQWIHPDDKDYIEKQFQSAIAGHNIGLTEFRIIRPDGKECVISANADVRFGDSGIPNKIIGYVLDITERKKIDEELRRSEYLLNQAQQLAHLGSYEYDMINKRYERSDELYRIFGITRDKIADEERMSRWIHPDDVEYLEKGYKSMESGHSIGPKEFRIIRPDGKERVVLANEDIILDDNGVPIKSIGYLLDITERKRAEEEREQLIIELQTALNNIKTLKGLLPICSSCKKIRSDKGYWSLLEVYIETHTDALFTHSLCPECEKELYGDEDWYKDMPDQ